MNGKPDRPNIGHTVNMCSIGGWRRNMLHFFRSPLLYQQHLYETYGNLVSLGSRAKPKYVFAFGADLNRQILTNPDLFEVSSELVKIPRETILGKMFYNNLLLMAGEKHRQHRKLIQPAFQHDQIMEYCKDMIELTWGLSDEWGKKEIIDVNLEMKKLTQRIAVKTLFGEYSDAELDAMGVKIAQLSKSILWASMFPYPIPFSPYARTLRSAGQLHEYICALIRHKRSSSQQTDVLAALIRAHDDDGTTLSDDELIGHAFSLYVAGHETTANALTWILFLLDQHPHILSDLLEELQGTIAGSELSLEKMMRLPLLEGAIKESLRLLPPAPIGTRITAASCELGGNTIPAHTNIFFSQWITHRNPELYPEPNRFLPERWSGIKPGAFEYLPFSAGPHMCIGWHFAMVEMKIILTILLQRHRIAISPNARISPNLQMRPVHGMPATIKNPDVRLERAPVRGTIQRLINLET